MTAQEKRSLKRVSNRYGVELTSTITISGQVLNASILDFNALGVLLELRNWPNSVPEFLESFELNYGQEQICFIEQPRLVRADQERGTMVVSLKETRKGEYLGRVLNLANRV
jgi:hypothetical protein